MRRTVGVTLYYALVLAFGAAWSPAQADPLGFAGDNIVMSGFQMRENREDGTTNWELSGEKASVVGAMVRMTDVRLLLYLNDGTQAVITSPACRFSRETKVVRSDDAIHVRHPGFDLDGKGYRVETDSQQLRIQHEVRMTIRDPELLGRPEVEAGKVRHAADPKAGQAPENDKDGKP